MTTQQARNKRKGSGFELDCVVFFRGEGFKVERLRLAGKHDEGDLAIEDEHGVIVVECKNEQSFKPAQWLAEALVERDNYCKARGLDPATVSALVIAKRRGKGVKDAYCISSVTEHFDLD